jgi:hypothetical protein
MTANIAMKTQNESTRPATAMAPDPSSRPAIRFIRASVRSMKKPTGVCITVETAPKAVSARPSSV